MMNNATKTLFDDGTVRMLVDDHNILVEELPRKPCKQVLRSTAINTHYAVCVMHRDDFIPANILDFPAAEDGKSVTALLDPTDGYDTIVTMIRGALQLLYKRPGNEQVERIQGVSVHSAERHYTKVTPEGVEKQLVECKDFTLEISWTKFSAYSPSSDFHQADPHYTQIAEKSAGAARKLYKLAVAKKTELAGLGWDAFSEWLRSNGVAFEYHFSQWT